MEEKGQILKSVGFPIKVLALTDKAASSIYKISRSALVIKALTEFIKNHDLEVQTGIKIDA